GRGDTEQRTPGSTEVRDEFRSRSSQRSQALVGGSPKQATANRRRKSLAPRPRRTIESSIIGAVRPDPSIRKQKEPRPSRQERGLLRDGRAGLTGGRRRRPRYPRARG